MQQPQQRRLSRSERYKRRIAGLSADVLDARKLGAELLGIIDAVAPELSDDGQQKVRAAREKLRPYQEGNNG